MDQVNEARCLYCCTIHACTLLLITTSLFLVLSYGYEYWMDLSVWKQSSHQFCEYLIFIGIEFFCSAIGWLGIYNHIRFITSCYTIWVILHVPLNAVIFWVSAQF